MLEATQPTTKQHKEFEEICCATHESLQEHSHMRDERARHVSTLSSDAFPGVASVTGSSASYRRRQRPGVAAGSLAAALLLPAPQATKEQTRGDADSVGTRISPQKN
eukprot:6214790-Pleurochrysis_carterae.AAC.2